MNSPQPSATLDAQWLVVLAPGEQFESTSSSGKWLIFRKHAEVDEAWVRVKALVLSGKLLCAKVSTRHRVLFGAYAEYVICVYTREWKRRRDVFRARAILREAGFAELLRYKRDLDTFRGIERFTYEA